MPDVKYPYMPPDRHLKYVPADDPFMLEAAGARRDCSGDPLFPVGAVLVIGDRVVARAGNGFSRGPGEPHQCPRLLAGCKSGEGYELCHLHDAEGHAEPMLMKAARDAGIDPTGGDVYMFGHWWCCEPCWKSMIDAGVRDVYVTDDAHERFSRENVYRDTLKNYPEEVKKMYGAA
jgi:deoxycytidylate deaminase